MSHVACQGPLRARGMIVPFIKCSGEFPVLHCTSPFSKALLAALSEEATSESRDVRSGDAIDQPEQPKILL